MNKITKIGLTALAGSLVATSAFAGAMSVSGSAKVTYTGGNGGSAANPYSNSKGISFSGSGEMDNGFTVSTGYTMTNAAFSSSYVSLDMGDSGTLHFMNGTSKAGLNKYQDMMPTAGEQVWDDTDTVDEGVVGHGNANAFGYEVDMMGVTASASYQKDGIGTNSSVVLVANDLGVEGLQVGAGYEGSLGDMAFWRAEGSYQMLEDLSTSGSEPNETTNDTHKNKITAELGSVTGTLSIGMKF